MRKLALRTCAGVHDAAWPRTRSTNTSAHSRRANSASAACSSLPDGTSRRGSSIANQSWFQAHCPNVAQLASSKAPGRQRTTSPGASPGRSRRLTRSNIFASSQSGGVGWPRGGTGLLA